MDGGEALPLYLIGFEAASKMRGNGKSDPLSRRRGGLMLQARQDGCVCVI